MATKSTIKTESTPRVLQKAVVASTVAAYLLQTGFTLWAICQQYPTNQNLSAYYISVGQMILTPLLFFVAAWLLNPRKLTKLGRAFESILLTTVGMMFIAIVGQIMVMIPLNLDTPVLWMAIPAVAAVVYLVGMVFLRLSKVWK